MTSSNGNIFRVTVHLWGESTSHRWIPPVKRSFDVFFDPRLIKLLSKQSRHGYFDTPSRSSWCHCDGNVRCQSRSDLNVWTYGTQPSTDIHTSGKNIVTLYYVSFLMKTARTQENHSWLLYPSTTSGHIFLRSCRLCNNITLDKKHSDLHLDPERKMCGGYI